MSCAFSFVIAMIIKNHVVAAACVPTGSMETTIMTGSRIFINRLAYVCEEPARGDIVSFTYPDDGKSNFLKRIMALPGETIQGIDGIIYIDGSPLDKDYTDIIFDEDFGPFTVPDNCYFMMGDNRNNSLDSRYWVNTYVEKEDIMGQAVLEFFPTVKSLIP